MLCYANVAIEKNQLCCPILVLWFLKYAVKHYTLTINIGVNSILYLKQNYLG